MCSRVTFFGVWNDLRRLTIYLNYSKYIQINIIHGNSTNGQSLNIQITKQEVTHARSNIDQFLKQKSVPHSLTQRVYRVHKNKYIVNISATHCHKVNIAYHVSTYINYIQRVLSQSQRATNIYSHITIIPEKTTFYYKQQTSKS